MPKVKAAGPFGQRAGGAGSIGAVLAPFRGLDSALNYLPKIPACTRKSDNNLHHPPIDNLR